MSHIVEQVEGGDIRPLRRRAKETRCSVIGGALWKREGHVMERPCKDWRGEITQENAGQKAARIVQSHLDVSGKGMKMTRVTCKARRATYYDSGLGFEVDSALTEGG